MKVFINAVRWFFGVVWCLGALAGFVSGEFLGGTINLILGLVVLPPTYRVIFKRNSSKKEEKAKSTYIYSRPERVRDGDPVRKMRNRVKTSQVEDAAITPITKITDSIGSAPNIKATVLQKPSDTPVITTHDGEQQHTAMEKRFPLHPILQSKEQQVNQDNAVYSYNEEDKDSSAEQSQATSSRMEIEAKATPVGDDAVIDVTGSTYKIDAPVTTKDRLVQKQSYASLVNAYHGQQQTATQIQPTSYAAFQNIEQQVDKISSIEAPISYDADQWKLGKRLKQKLELNTQEISLLNKVAYFDNAFTSMEGCCMATAKLYLSVMKELKKQLQRKGSSITKEIQFMQEMAVVVYKAQESYYWSSYDDSYTRQRVATDVYVTIFKRCEYAVREAFLHKRKISTAYTGNNEELASEFEARIGEIVDAAIPKLISLVEQPDEATEIELNAHNVTRWKTQLEQLSIQLSDGDKETFIEGVYRLGRLNKKNPSVEHVFYEASKLISKHDKEEALRFYLYYLHYDFNSNTVDNRQLTKTIQKSLFRETGQLKRFEEILNQFMEDEDLQKALAEVPSIYTKQRKKIQLDLSTIREVQQQHSGTVELLNEYLQDENDPTALMDASSTSTDDNEIEGEEIQLEIKLNTAAPTASLFIPEVSLNEVQQELLHLFQSSDLSLAQQQVELFSKTRGVFRNQLIDSINESCYEQLDDVLIEEDGDTYAIYENYFQLLIRK